MVSDAPEISVVVPMHDERGTLDELVDRVRAALDGVGMAWELVVVDDASTDGSGERLDELAAGDSRIMPLHFAARSGQTSALDAGFGHARGDLIAILDADLQTFPEEIPALVDRLRREDVGAVVGIRAERHDSRWKRFSSTFANGVRNRLTREDIRDTGCPLKVVRREAVRRLKLFDGMHRFLPTLLRMEGFTVVQVPVQHVARSCGRTKYGTWDRAFRGLRDALAVRWMQDRHLRWKVR